MSLKSKKKNRSGNISIFSGRKANKTHLFTKGGEYSLDGENYIGEYYIEGEFAYTGPAPVSIDSNVNRIGDPDLVNSKIKLVTESTSLSGRILRRIYTEKYQYDYEKLKLFDINVLNFVDPTPYLYQPTEAAYDAGEDQRFFVQKRGSDSSYAIEISPTQWEMIGQFKGIDDGLYAFTSVTWKLVGAYDIIAQQNELALFKAQRIIPSILYSVKSFTEFARFTRF